MTTDKIMPDSAALSGMSDERLAAIFMDAIKGRSRLAEAMLVRIAGSFPHTGNSGIGIPMLGMHAVDSLNDANPHKPLSVNLYNYPMAGSGAAVVAIAQKDGVPHVLIGNSHGKKPLVIPGGYFDTVPRLSPQGLYAVLDHDKFSAYERAQEKGDPLPTEPINYLRDKLPEGDKDKRANAIREMWEETGIEFPPEKLQLIDVVTERGIRKTSGLPDQTHQHETSYFLADMRDKKGLPPIEEKDDFANAVWAPVTDISKVILEDGTAEYSYHDQTIRADTGSMIEKGIALLRVQDFEKLGVSKEGIIKFAATRARALEKENPLDAIPSNEFGQAAIDWHQKALEIAREMDKILYNVASQKSGRGK